jgi:hypothetical protein
MYVLFFRREQNCEDHNLASLAKYVANRSLMGLARSVSSFSGIADECTTVCNHDGGVSALV